MRRPNVVDFSFVFVPWASLYYPHQSSRLAIVSSINDYPTGGSGFFSSAALSAIATLVPSAATSSHASRAAAYAARSEKEILARPNDTVWASVNADMRWLESNKSGDLIKQPLWLIDVRGSERYQANFPDWMRGPFDRLANRGADSSRQWRFWINWYRGILPNSRNAVPHSAFGEEVDVEIAGKGKVFWERDRQRVLNDINEIAGLKEDWVEGDDKRETMKTFIVNLLDGEDREFSLDEIYEEFEAAGYSAERPSIRGRLNSLTSERRISRTAPATYASLRFFSEIEGGSYISAPPPEVPDVRPAAIEPIWKKGKLAVSNERISSDIDKETLAAALESLRDELNEIADEAAGVANIDQRPVDYIRRLATKIPEVELTQTHLFRLGHAREVLDTFASVTDQEWPDFLAARYRKLILHYDRTVRQFPKWRAFVRNANDQTLTSEQVAGASQIVESIAVELETNDAHEFVEVQVSSALRSAAAPIIDWQNEIQFGSEQLAEDLLESVNNVLKRTVELALAIKGASGWDGSWISSTSADAFAAFSREAKKSIVSEFGKLGKGVGPALGRFLKRLAKVSLYGGGASGSSALLVTRLFTLYPDTFGWLEPILRFLHLM
jgi:hypothetical protein